MWWLRTSWLTVAIMVLSLVGCAAPSRKATMPTDLLPIPASPPVPMENQPQAATSESRAPSQMVEEPVVVETVYILPDPRLIEQRIQTYALKKEEWQTQLDDHLSIESPWGDKETWLKCAADIDRIFADYTLVRDQGDGLLSGKGGQDFFWKVFAEDLAFFEGKCPAIFAKHAEALTTRQTTNRTEKMKAAIAEILSMCAEGRSGDALIAYEELAISYPEALEDPEFQRNYGVFLTRQGEYEKAADVLTELIKKTTNPIDDYAVYRLWGDLLFSLGRFDEAHAHYKELARKGNLEGMIDPWVSDKLSLLENPEAYTDELKFYMTLLRAWLTFDGNTIPSDLNERAEQISNAFPGSKFAESAKNLALLAEKRAQGGTTNVPGPGVINSIPADSTANGPESQGEEESFRKQWEEANLQLDQRQYDEAIKGFFSLYKTSYGPEAKRKRQEALDLVATEKREQAANLFIKARSTQDPGLQKERLLASRQLLLEIHEKYSEASVADKARQNLMILEKFIRQIDPLLLDGIEPSSTGGLGR